MLISQHVVATGIHRRSRSISMSIDYLINGSCRVHTRASCHVPIDFGLIITVMMTTMNILLLHLILANWRGISVLCVDGRRGERQENFGLIFSAALGVVIDRKLLKSNGRRCGGRIGQGSTYQKARRLVVETSTDGYGITVVPSASLWRCSS